MSMRRDGRRRRGAALTALILGAGLLAGSLGSHPAAAGDPAIPRTAEAHRLAQEVIARANASYYRVHEAGGAGFDATYVVTRAEKSIARLRIRAAPADAAATVTIEGDLEAFERTALENHGRALAGPLCGPFVATEATFGYPIHAAQRKGGYALDLSGAGEIPGVAESVLEVAFDFLQAQEVGRLQDGTEIALLRKGKASKGRNYLTYQSFRIHRPGVNPVHIEYAWRWAPQGETMFVRLFVAQSDEEGETRRWDLLLDRVTFGEGGGQDDVRPAPPPPAPAAAREGPPPMRKYVSEQARFVLYAPVGWEVREGADRGYWWVGVENPASGSQATTVHGLSPVTGDIRALAGSFLSALRERRSGLRVSEARMAPDGTRLHCRGTYEANGRGTMAWRSWFSKKDRDFTYSRIEAPEGEFARQRPLLLSLLVNVGAVKGAFQEVEAQPLEMRPHQLPDGSARFLLPGGWQAVPLGPTFFLAHDPGKRYAFLVANARAISPRLGVSPPGVAVSEPLSPHAALVFFANQMGLLRNVRMIEVHSQPDLARLMATAYTAGPVEAEDFTYTFDGDAGRCKGFTLGITFGSHLQVSWSLAHLTATAPVDEFDTMAATFRRMAESYQIDDEFAARYVREGQARLREMVRRTSEMVSRNAAEIRQMMYAAYKERSDSQDYIDYLRTRYIRGEADWVSRAEGGTVYRTDSWGIQNQTTGERWDGQPFNYVNFRGGEEGYGDLVPIDNRAFYEAYVRGR